MKPSKILFRISTILAYSVGVGLSGVASILGNPIAGMFSLTMTLLLDARDYLKVESSPSGDPSREQAKLENPVTEGRKTQRLLFAIRMVLFFLTTYCAIAFGLETASESPGGTTNFSVFFGGMSSMESGTAKIFAILAGVFSLFYGVVAVGAYVSNYFAKRS